MLRRRKYLGIKCVCFHKEIIVTKVLNRASALKVGDHILEVNKIAVYDLNLLQNIVANLIDRKNVLVKLLRNNTVQIVYQELFQLPYEQSKGLIINYSEHKYNNESFRIITTSKKNMVLGKKIIVFLQGIECQSIDFPFNENHPYRQLLYGLTGECYSTMRIDLFGNGDSQGDKYKNYNFRDIVNLYESLVQCLYHDDYKIYLFGYSIGGVIAPIIANELPEMVKGILIFDTILPDLYTYLINNQIRQELVAGMDKTTVKKNAIEYQKVLNEILKKKKNPRYFISSNPQYACYFEGNNYFLGHIYKYAQQIYDLNLLELWKSIQKPICIIVGEQDYAIDYNQHIALYNMLNVDHNVKLLSAPINHNFEEKGEFSTETILNIEKIMNTFFEKF